MDGSRNTRDGDRKPRLGGALLKAASDRLPVADRQAVYAGVHGWLTACHASRRPAVAVSGGADSMCLALLARDWCGPGGDALALIVDHGLRAESSEEAALTAARLQALGIACRILTLQGLRCGPGLAARARIARYEALFAATREAGRVDLLLGHHRRDQAETLLMRRLSHSGPLGLAGMARVTEHRDVRVLRPLLDVAPGVLRAILVRAGISWVEDPSNRDPAALRTRLRLQLDDFEGEGQGVRALAEAACGHGGRRVEQDRRIAAELAAKASLFPEGYALLAPGPVSAAALGALIRAIGGAGYVPDGEKLARIAADPGPSVLGGVRLMAAGRAGPGLLLVREAAAMASPVTARAGVLWDRRFLVESVLGVDASVGAVGADASALRKMCNFPDAVLRALPALRVNGMLVEVPHIGYVGGCGSAGMAVGFAPAMPASGAPFGH